MRVVLFQNDAGFFFAFHHWAENRNRMARIDLELIKVLHSARVKYEEDQVIIQHEFFSHDLEKNKEKLNKALKVLDGFIISPEVENNAC